MTKKSIEVKEIEDLFFNQGYVFLKTDAGYDPEKKNSIKDHYGLSTLQAQAIKRDPVVQAMIKSSRSTEIVLVDSRETDNNNESADTTEVVVTAEMV